MDRRICSGCDRCTARRCRSLGHCAPPGTAAAPARDSRRRRACQRCNRAHPLPVRGRTVATGVFSLPKAGGTFAMIVVGEIFYGIAVGWLSLRLRKWAGEPRVEITLSLMTPYLAFWVPEYLGGSGVLATVTCGLYISWNGPLLISSATRLQGIFFWDLLVYL